MNIPSSLPSVPSFGSTAGNNSSSPAAFIEFLQSLITANLDGDPFIRIPASSKDTWITVVNGLSEHFLAAFPTHGAMPWNAMHEKVKLVEITLDVIQRILVRVEGLFVGTGDFGYKTFVVLLYLCNLLDVWPEAEVRPENRIPLPSEVRAQVFKTMVEWLRCMGGSVTSTAKSEEPPWKMLKAILLDCLGLVQDFINMPSSLKFPLTVSLAETPRITDASGRDSEALAENTVGISIESPSRIPLLLSLTLELLNGVLCPSLLCQWFLSDVTRRTFETARSAFDYCLSPSCAATDAKRAACLSQTIAAASSLSCSSFEGSQVVVEYMSHTLLFRRLRDGPAAAWESVVQVLIKYFDTAVAVAPVKAQVESILDTLRKEDWDETGKSLHVLTVTYLRRCLPHLDIQTLLLIKDLLAERTQNEQYATLLESVTAQLQRRLEGRMVTDEGPIEHTHPTWRLRVRTAVQAVIAPDEVVWMDDDDTLTNVQYAARALHDVEQRFSRALNDSSAQARASLADNLAALLCLLVHPDDSKCSPSSAEIGLSTIPACLTAVSRLLDGPAEEVTVVVRKRSYGALARAVTHHTVSPSDDKLHYGVETAARGMEDDDRSVRLSAGRVMVALVQMFQRMSFPCKQTEPLFGTFYRLLDTAKDRIKETTLITVGSIGKIARIEVLGQVVCCLIAQLGRQNPVLRGTAYMQLLTLSKFLKKSPYNLVSPYMNQIAPFLVSRMCTEPSLLAESCHFISVSSTDFISATLTRTLPQLFARSDLKVLEKIAKDLGKKPSTLFLNHSHDILAYIFLQDAAKINVALDFIVQVLSKAAENATIDIQSVVKSCLTPLLAELIIVMGDESEERALTGVQALQKVEQLLPSPTNAPKSTPFHDLSAFLKTYMLGVITHMNDMLQEVQGRKSVESKRQILRSLGAMVAKIGSAINNVAPQIMATLQTMLSIAPLAEATLQSWHVFLITLDPHDIGPYVGPTSASFIALWSSFTESERVIAKRCLEYIIFDVGQHLGQHMDEVVDLASVPELSNAQEKLRNVRNNWTSKEKLQRILERSSSDNLTVATQSLKELKRYLFIDNVDFVRALVSGDIFDPLVGQIMTTLLGNACRDGEEAESLRLLAFECMGILGALDPDRFEISYNDSRMIMLSNFQDESESVTFALHLIRDVLVGAFRSTSDIQYQSHLAYAIQELLRFCKFTASLVGAGSGSVPIKVRNRWNSLPKHVLETVTPLLGARFTLQDRPLPHIQHPIYREKSTYREWIQLWTAYLISRASGNSARTIFSVFRSAVRNKDVAVANHILPHLVLNILISGDEDEARNIRFELLAVLEDQVDPSSDSSADKKLFSAQAVFTLMDHLNKWVRLVRQDITSRKSESKRSRIHPMAADAEEQVLRVDSILCSIDLDLMAKAALQCKAYARSLMSFERQIVTLQGRNAKTTELHGYYERLHEIYAYLDEPDGMEGVSTLILSPSLEHQIRQHESTGRWTSAQSCWEVRLQHAPDDVDLHLGLLRCLRNLGHYDTLRTHVKGVLTKNPAWEPALAGFQVESAWTVGDWDEVRHLAEQIQDQTSAIVIARILLAMRMEDSTAVSMSLTDARTSLGAAITASGATGYRRAYDSVVDLHVVHELELIHQVMIDLPVGRNTTQRRQNALNQLSLKLSARLDSTLPTFRTQEPVLSMRRIAFGLSTRHNRSSEGEIGRSWLASAKIARKSGHWQTAYSAMLQAQQHKTPFAFVEGAKLTKASGEPLRALQELDNSLHLHASEDVIDLTEDDDETKKAKAKAQVLLARWMNESDRYELNHVAKSFGKATELWPKWESAQFHLGRFQDECYKALGTKEQKSRGTRMVFQTVKAFSRAIRYGSKYVYQTVPRLLTLWLDMGESDFAKDGFEKVNGEVMKAIKHSPVYKWYTAFPQIVSRVGHNNKNLYHILSNLIASVIQEYPKQALWLFTAVVKSTKAHRESRGREILDKLRNNPNNARREVPELINECLSMINELLALCDYPLKDDHKKTLNMSKDFPRLAALAPSRLIIPLQESLTASLPPTSSSETTHQPFPPNAPIFQQFADDIEIMRSLAKPRKITIRGDDGQIYMFLGKPKDDLRKDARLMDFNAIINKLLKANSESRRRQLHIRTYGVVTLNEECGFIQWVPNTIPVRPVLLKSYSARNIQPWSGAMGEIFNKIKDASDKDAADLFLTEVLPQYPPVFHEWFIETFPEPSVWLASRLAYGRTAAVMSMVGFILGLGDRHCENMLLDITTGDVIHVDFNCLFEKGKSLDTPERVPFRLTQNIVDGLGVTGVEGVFRIACEVTMQLLRNNKDTLMSVLDAFVHDPLVEWEDEKRKLERDASRRNVVKSSVDLQKLAKNALSPIEKKLKGIYTTSRERPERDTSASSLVQMLIQEATDPCNLAKMYAGWAPWH